MIFRLLKVASILFTAITVTGQAPSKKVEVHWTRKVVRETKPGGRTLVIAVDIPDQPTLRQRSVFRQSFSREQKSELLAALRRYQRPSLFNPRLRGDDEISANALWPIDRAWSARDEAAYSAWIHEFAKPDMLSGAGVQVDCADFAITMRWIYAHDHHLPAANSLAASGTLFGSWQSTPDWDRLATNADWRQDERFKAALRYLLTNSYTHSLMDDLYPVTITQDYVLPGTIFLTLFQASGHTRTIFNIGKSDLCGQDTSCIQIIFGNEPASELGYVDQLVPWKLAPTEGGFLRYRWPELKNGEWSLRAGKAMPGYSMEQYGWSDDEYSQNVFVRLGLSSSSESQFVTLGTAVGKVLNERLAASERGYFLCNLVPCKRNDADYNQWSTPQRDHAVAAQILAFQKVASRTNLNDPAVVGFINGHNDWMFDGAPYQMIDVMTKTLFPTFGSDPRSDFFDRWGVETPIVLENKLRGLAQVAFDNWMWREDLVVTAHDSTARLDQAFRAFRQHFTSQYNAAPLPVQSTLRATMTAYVTAEKFCPANQDSLCTMYDFLIADPSRLDHMSSDPSAPYASRYGF